jgi:hypothetical protein
MSFNIFSCFKKKPQPEPEVIGMRVYTFQNYGPALLGEDQLDKPTGPRIGWNDSIPTTGYWKVGDRVYSTVPAQAGLSWVCVAEGSPGTWVLSYIQTAPPVISKIKKLDAGRLTMGPNYTWDGGATVTRTQEGIYQFTDIPNNTALATRNLQVITPNIITSFAPYTEYTYLTLQQNNASQFTLYCQRGTGGALVDSLPDL